MSANALDREFRVSASVPNCASNVWNVSAVLLDRLSIFCEFYFAEDATAPSCSEIFLIFLMMSDTVASVFCRPFWVFLSVSERVLMSWIILSTLIS